MSDQSWEARALAAEARATLLSEAAMAANRCIVEGNPRAALATLMTVAAVMNLVEDDVSAAPHERGAEDARLAAEARVAEAEREAADRTAVIDAACVALDPETPTSTRPGGLLDQRIYALRDRLAATERDRDAARADALGWAIEKAEKG